MTEMQFDVPSFTASGDGLQSKGASAGNAATTGATNLTPPGASSPAGAQIALLTGQLQTGLATAGPTLVTKATQNGVKTHNAMSAIQAQDAASANLIRSATSPGAAAADAAGGAQGAGSDAAAAAGGAAAEAADGANLLDADSIDQEARDKAEQMLSGDQLTSQMGQMLGQAAQAGAQAGQQISQQLNQAGQQMGQVFQQASQQIGQLVGKAGQSLSAPSLDLGGLDATGGLDAGLGGGGGVPDFGGGAGDFGGGGGVPDFGGGAGDFGAGGGLDENSTPTPAMTTSAALMPSPLTPPGSATSTSNSTAARATAPMMMPPMMPMAGAGNPAAQGEKTKRDPVIYAEGPLYEPPAGVEQTLGATPAIETAEPPFGDASEDAAAR